MKCRLSPCTAPPLSCRCVLPHHIELESAAYRNQPHGICSQLSFSSVCLPSPPIDQSLLPSRCPCSNSVRRLLFGRKLYRSHYYIIATNASNFHKRMQDEFKTS